VPGISNRNVVHILEVTGGYVYREDAHRNDNPHSLPVIKLVTVSKTDLPDILQRAIAASRRAVSNFTKYRQDIDIILNAKAEEKNGNPYIEQASEIFKRALASDDKMLQLTAAMFALKNPDKII
jgi:hypothetical protein